MENLCGAVTTRFPSSQYDVVVTYGGSWTGHWYAYGLVFKVYGGDIYFTVYTGGTSTPHMYKGKYSNGTVQYVSV